MMNLCGIVALASSGQVSANSNEWWPVALAVTVSLILSLTVGLRVPVTGWKIPTWKWSQWPGLNVPIDPSLLTQVPQSHLVLNKTNNDKGFAGFQDNSCADGTNTVTTSSLHLQYLFTGAFTGGDRKAKSEKNGNFQAEVGIDRVSRLSKTPPKPFGSGYFSNCCIGKEIITYRRLNQVNNFQPTPTNTNPYQHL